MPTENPRPRARYAQAVRIAGASTASRSVVLPPSGARARSPYQRSLLRSFAVRRRRGSLRRVGGAPRIPCTGGRAISAPRRTGLATRSPLAQLCFQLLEAHCGPRPGPTIFAGQDGVTQPLRIRPRLRVFRCRTAPLAQLLARARRGCSSRAPRRRGPRRRRSRPCRLDRHAPCRAVRVLRFSASCSVHDEPPRPRMTSQAADRPRHVEDAPRRASPSRSMKSGPGHPRDRVLREESLLDW